MTKYFGPDPAQSRLRATVHKLGRLVARASEAGIPDELAARLRATVADLEGQLALGPEPAVRKCPRCGTIGMRNATICGNCWTHLDEATAPAPE